MADPTVSRGDQQVPGHGTPIGLQTHFPVTDVVPSGASAEEPAEAPAEESVVDATEAAEAKAEELNVDLSEVQGTGKDGRITEPDVEAAHASAEPAAD